MRLSRYQKVFEYRLSLHNRYLLLIQKELDSPWRKYHPLQTKHIDENDNINQQISRLLDEWTKGQDGEKDFETHSALKDEFSDSDWDEFEDPDEENMSGKWFNDKSNEGIMYGKWFFEHPDEEEDMSGKLFSDDYVSFNQKNDGTLDGSYKHKANWITGKVRGEDVVFFVNWSDDNVWIMKGRLSDRMRLMNVKIEDFISNTTIKAVFFSP